MQKEMERALHYLKRVGEDEEISPAAKHLMAAIKGDTEDTKTSSEMVYAERLFDYYAETFDQSLHGLQYKTPQKILMMVKEHLGNAQYKIVDLGCGTGLVAKAFHDNIQTIVGSDLSQKMLNKASEINVYADLVKLDALSHVQKLENKWDLAIASDVFVYIRDLHPIFMAIKSKKNIRYFAFSVEINRVNSDDVYLQETGRYCHRVSSIERFLNEIQVEIMESKEVELRTNNGEPVKGQLLLAKYY